MRIIAIILLVFCLTDLGAQIYFPAQSGFSYLKGSEASELQESWVQPEFDDQLWESGPAPFWYGDGFDGTLLEDMQDNYSTLYLRSSFQCENHESLDKVVFSINYDDAFIIWINGQEVLHVNAPASPSFNSLATAAHESGSYAFFTVDSADIQLNEGTNYIAVQGFNINLSSTDFHFDVQLESTPNLPEYPDEMDVIYSAESGFYDNPFQLSLSTPDPGAQIVYTLDGSNPQNSITAITQDAVALVGIDPGSNSGRATTPAVIVRASLKKQGFQPSRPTSRTFIYLDQVKTQSHPGGDWPLEAVNGQTIDLEVDSRIINHPEYKEMIDEAFYEIPSISIITDLSNLFNPVTGIYVNARQDGVAWERECSVELINPDGNTGFGVNAGLRIRGGFSRAPEFAKHSFRLLFKADYGDSKLHFPLFGDEGPDVFDNIDLRTAQNYAWSNGDSRNTMVKEVFARDSQRDMGQPYTRSRYYHLYLNGMYWGLYQTQERSEADYAANYFKGSSDDYDVVKVEALLYDVQATDGSLTSWNNVYNRTQSGFLKNEDYFELEGKDENGSPVPGATCWIDMDNLIDFMIATFYIGNLDGPVSEPLRNKQPNNFYAIYSRRNTAEGYRFFCHDTEHSLLGAYDNRVNLADRTDGNNMVVYEFKEFHPQWLHHKLSENSEYKLRFADRASMHLSNYGALSPVKALERFNKRVSQIDTAIIAESARWGDARGITEPYTRNDNWMPEIYKMQEEYFPVRTAVVMDQLKQAGLYSELDAPLVKSNHIPIHDSSFKFEGSTSITFSNPNPLGILYYTMDGSDPREIGGEIYSDARISEDGNTPYSIFNTTVLKARIYDNGTWGPLTEINFLKSDEDYSSLKLTELHYHPLDDIVESDTSNGKKFEFIEFKNTGEDAINLSGLTLDSAVSYEFPDDAILGAGQFYVVSSKTVSFVERYGIMSSGNYGGYFSNAGEEVLLKDAQDNFLINFIYNDTEPWPEMADGYGFSMVSSDRNPSGNPEEPSYWKHSLNIGGSPFEDEPYPAMNQDRWMESAEVNIYPNPARDIVNIVLRTERQTKEMNVEIYAATGILVYRELHPVITSVNLRELNLEPGIYIIRLSCPEFTGSYRLVH